MTCRWRVRARASEAAGETGPHGDVAIRSFRTEPLKIQQKNFFKISLKSRNFLSRKFLAGSRGSAPCIFSILRWCFADLAAEVAGETADIGEADALADFGHAQLSGFQECASGRDATAQLIIFNAITGDRLKAMGEVVGIEVKALSELGQ